jgi:hypothetical protein
VAYRDVKSMLYWKAAQVARNTTKRKTYFDSYAGENKRFISTLKKDYTKFDYNNFSKSVV